MTDADYAYLRSELGEADRGDLDARFTRLGSLEDVAVEILRERKAALVADPLTVTVQGIATLNNAENVKALERQIAGLGKPDEPGVAEGLPVPLVRHRSR
ncbi:hypothetical protein ACGF5O_22055 [Streptomyces sp. NPDC048291]|uniref:hypothetical protein n=1 Tax=Streptomyces sp. NPDC048291 TaxID=3365530 RepID=UPI0037215CE1